MINMGEYVLVTADSLQIEDNSGKGKRLLYYIIELVDCIFKDSADTQYMLIQTNFSKSPTYKPL